MCDQEERAGCTPQTPPGKQRSQDHDPDNLLDRATPKARRIRFSELFREREDALWRESRLLEPRNGEPARVLSVGCGLDARRGLELNMPHVWGVDSNPDHVAAARARGNVQGVELASASKLPFPDGMFDVVFFRLVLHHVVFQQPLGPVFQEASRVLKPGGHVVMLEPSLWHPVGLLLAASNRLGWSRKIMGSTDDCPLDPLSLKRQLRAQGFSVRVVGVEYGWRRLPVPVQDLLAGLAPLGGVPGLSHLAHTIAVFAAKHR
jgi:SAM-dependent methyltransferase